MLSAISRPLCARRKLLNDHAQRRHKAQENLKDARLCGQRRLFELAPADSQSRFEFSKT
jgi:hypothetical protein